MIKKLQKRFIFITMAGISFIFVLILITINISMTLSSQKQGYRFLYEYSDRQLFGNMPEHPKPDRIADDKDERLAPKNDWFNDMRIFSVSYNSDGSLMDIAIRSNPNLTDAAVTEMAAKAVQSNKEQGIINGYLFLCQNTESNKHIYFFDYAPEKGMSQQLFYICLWVGLAGIVMILIPVILLSRWVTKPVSLAFDRQKQFIADASHELKTPLTIITANAEVLESSLSGNKWLTHILEQSKRMRSLINSLLELARLDSCNDAPAFIDFSLSKAVQNTSLSFESLAFEYGKTFDLDIGDGLSLNGNEASIKQLVTILLDNAFKYSDAKGTIQITLARHGDKKELKVRNTGRGISPADQKRIFERFYRSDASRSRESGGYGLGLAIAQSIVDAHKGTISVKSDGAAYTEFSVLFP